MSTTQAGWTEGLRLSFKKSERVRSRKDIAAIFKHGTRIPGRGMRLVVVPSQGSVPRVVVTTVRKYGNAVQRNRARRVVSECWRLTKHRVLPGLDIVVVLFQDDDTFETRSRQLAYILKKAGVLSV